jgi:hypothetical protein
MLSVEMSKSYIDIANAVNERTIGVFATVPSVTGNSWFIGKMSPTSNSLRQQTVRQVFLFTSAGSIAHGINTAQIGGFVAIYGTFTDGTNFYPLPYVDVNAANNQVNVYVSPTNIVITAGGGSPPTISSGFVVLEWLSQV